MLHAWYILHLGNFLGKCNKSTIHGASGSLMLYVAINHLLLPDQCTNCHGQIELDVYNLDQRCPCRYQKNHLNPRISLMNFIDNAVTISNISVVLVS